MPVPRKSRAGALTFVPAKETDFLTPRSSVESNVLFSRKCRPADPAATRPDTAEEEQARATSSIAHGTLSILVALQNQH